MALHGNISDLSFNGLYNLLNNSALFTDFIEQVSFYQPFAAHLGFG